MNDLINLNSLVSEIKFFENQAVVSYWEIGKRLAQAKEQVPHGEWERWIKDNLGYTKRTAQRLIQVSEEYSNTTTVSHLNFSKVLALTSIKDETEREEFVANNSVEDMTVRELKAEIKDYKQKIEVQNTEIDKLKNQKPKIIEKEVVVEPADYKMVLLDLDTTYERLNEADEQLKKLQKDNEELKNKLVIESNKKKEAVEQLAEEQQKEELIREINGFAWTINGFIQKVGGLIYLSDFIDEVPSASKKLFISSAKTLNDWSSQLVYNIENKGVEI